MRRGRECRGVSRASCASRRWYSSSYSSRRPSWAARRRRGRAEARAPWPGWSSAASCRRQAILIVLQVLYRLFHRRDEVDVTQASPWAAVTSLTANQCAGAIDFHAPGCPSARTHATDLGSWMVFERGPAFRIPPTGDQECPACFSSAHTSARIDTDAEGTEHVHPGKFRHSPEDH